MSITYNGENNAPLVTLSHVGDGCSPMARGAPVPAQTAPATPQQPNMIQIDNPAPVSKPTVIHHT